MCPSWGYKKPVVRETENTRQLANKPHFRRNPSPHSSFFHEHRRRYGIYRESAFYRSCQLANAAHSPFSSTILEKLFPLITLTGSAVSSSEGSSDLSEGDSSPLKNFSSNAKRPASVMSPSKLEDARKEKARRERRADRKRQVHEEQLRCSSTRSLEKRRGGGDRMSYYRGTKRFYRIYQVPIWTEIYVPFNLHVYTSTAPTISSRAACVKAVSYTHLTLPTICSV